MSVPVSLVGLCEMTGTRHLWPTEFNALVTACEKNVEDRLPFGVVADWCDENDEPEMGDAFRWLFKRPQVTVVKQVSSWNKEPTYTIGNPPLTMEIPGGFSVAQMVARLVPILKQMREALA